MPLSPRLLRPRAAASTAFDPRAISGLAVWYDAADAGSVTLNGSNVAELRDKSGNGKHMSQSTAANQPAYVASAQNTRSVIRSAGGNVHLRRESGGSALSESASYLGETAHSLFIACKATPAAGQYLFWAANFAATNTQRLILAGPWATIGVPYYIFDSGSSSTGRLNTTVNRGSAAHVIAVRRDGSAYAAWTDGTASGTATNASAPAVNFTGTFSLMAEINAAGAYQAGAFIGDLYEVIHYNRAVTDAERQQVERYLGRKWGIYPYAPPNYADADVNAYINAVEAADQDHLETGVRNAINTFITGCKADGIWSAIKASCILMGARTLAGALTPLVGTAPTAFNFGAGDYNRRTGLLGNGNTKYLNTNRAANADPQNNFHASVFGSALDAGGGSIVRAWLGSASAGNATKNIGLFHFNGSYYFNVRRDSANTLVNATLATSGFVGAIRTSSTNVVGRFSGADNTFSVPSQPPTSEAVAIFASTSGGTIADYSAARIAFYSVGESLTLASLDSRVTTLYNAIGAAIP